ncbi:MAG TPA: TonB-dependent copper receptor [Mariprofundaceae bacterium]|nr:TonB-dependent copper receptor [Mariprofundaceae bacterium]
MGQVSYAADTGTDNLTGTLDEVVVTAPRSQDPLTVVTDPKAPRQPIPAHDGADYLKNIPGFSTIRKGGTDGDPVLRGMAGSRLNILLDGEMLLGGCGMRMDPPTAYVFPAAYDRITVLKGPQTVAYGPGNSAGVVLFERDVKRFKEPGVKLDTSATVGSFGRNDERVDIRAGMPEAYAQASATHSHMGEYKDGSGAKVHSPYTRWSANAAFGWTPSDDTLVELTGAKSDGEAAYADRAMDGAKFARDNVGLKFSKQHLSEFVQRIDAQVYYNYVDHVMDNYSLRTFTPTAMMANPTVSNPDRKTTGGKLMAGFVFGDATDARLGFDYQNNIHSIRSSMNQLLMPYQSKARVQDALFRNYGLFLDVTHDFSDQDRVLAGIRGDHWRVEDKRTMVATGMTTVANPTSGQVRNENLGSGFLRYEHDLAAAPATFYAGVGKSTRFPDYWELIQKETLTTVSAFNTRAEKTTQLDAGIHYNGDTVSASVSGFYSWIKDYNLIESNIAKGMRLATVNRNINASTWGGEVSAAWVFVENWKVDGALAYVYGKNTTNNQPLGQMSPLDTRLSVNYDNKVFSGGALWRLVAAQNRYAVNQGNIVGQDIGRTGGFGVLSLHAGWKARKNIQLTAGVDNVFDKLYAEHLSRSGSAVAGYDTTTRVNEMGRSLWLSVNLTL